MKSLQKDAQIDHWRTPCAHLKMKGSKYTSGKKAETWRSLNSACNEPRFYFCSLDFFFLNSADESFEMSCEAYWECGRRLSGEVRWTFRLVCLSEPVVYTWQTLIIIIMIIICNRHSGPSGIYLLGLSHASVQLCVSRSSKQSLTGSLGTVLFTGGCVSKVELRVRINW